eukprot:scaffold113617_cov63-Phaeocystis_antarctica.AAC.3
MVVMPIVMMTTDPPSGDGAEAESRRVTALPFVPTTMIGGGGGGLGHGGGEGGGGGGEGEGGGEGGRQPVGRPSLSALLIKCSTTFGHSQVALRVRCLTLHGAGLEAALLCKVRHESEPIAEVGVAVRVALGVAVLARNLPPLLHGVARLVRLQAFPITSEDVVVAVACEQVDVPVRVALETIVTGIKYHRQPGGERRLCACGGGLL